MSDTEEKNIQQEKDLDQTQEFRRNVVAHYAKLDPGSIDKGTLAVVLGAAADMDKQVLNLKKLKQDDESALRADKIAMMGLATIKELNKQHINPFRRDSSGTAVESSEQLNGIKVSDTVTEEVILTGQEGYRDFDARMSALFPEENK